MTETASSPKKLAEKFPLLKKHWFWIILAILIIAGCYITASYFWNQFKGKAKK